LTLDESIRGSFNEAEEAIARIKQFGRSNGFGVVKHHANRDRDGLLRAYYLVCDRFANQLQIRSFSGYSKGSVRKRQTANFVFESASRRPGTPGQSLFSIQLITMGNYPPKTSLLIAVMN